MFDKAAYPLVADRWTPFVRDIDIVGEDFTDAVFRMEIRDRKDGGNTRATLTTQTTDVEGVRLVEVITADAGDVTSYAAAGVTVEVGDSISRIRIRINETTMEAMDVAADAGQTGSNGTAYYDLHITPSGGDKFVAMFGTFTIDAGATNG